MVRQNCSDFLFDESIVFKVTIVILLMAEWQRKTTPLAGCNKDASYLYPIEKERDTLSLGRRKEKKNMIVCNQTSSDGII